MNLLKLITDLESVTTSFREGLGINSESKSLASFIKKTLPLIKDKCVLCGGLLVAEYGDARATQDLDVFVASSKIKDVENILQKKGFENPDIFDYTKKPKTFIYKFKKEGIYLGCLYFGNEEFNNYIEKSKRKTNLFGFDCFVLDINSFIITKLISGRYKDLGDIENIVKTSLDKIDVDEIKSWCSKLGIMSKFELFEKIINGENE
jgi:hypothetical protein